MIAIIVAMWALTTLAASPDCSPATPVTCIPDLYSGDGHGCHPIDPSKPFDP